jgi:hypothetical protein
MKRRIEAVREEPMSLKIGIPLVSSNIVNIQNKNLLDKRESNSSRPLSSVLLGNGSNKVLQRPDTTLNSREKEPSFTSEAINKDNVKIFVDVEQRVELIPEGSRLVDEYYLELKLRKLSFNIISQR